MEISGSQRLDFAFKNEDMFILCKEIINNEQFPVEKIASTIAS